MTVDELAKLGNDKPVRYKGDAAVFENLSMAFMPFSARKQPMLAKIRLANGRRIYVAPGKLHPDD